MAKTSDPNPLHFPQREKAGAKTFAKYDYQYHWALYRILQEQGESKEYAVFVEYHEDVVLINSLKSEEAEFEFNQIKTTGKKFTVKALTKIERGNSVLGKLLSSCLNKTYSDKIREINLVAVKGFGLSLKNSELDLDVIRITDITENDIQSIEEKLKSELVFDSLPSNLQFIIPDLSEQNVRQIIIGKIAELLSRLFPSATFKPVDIYNLLYHEITRKGMNTTDYSDWNDLINKKALTSTTVSTLIQQFTNMDTYNEDNRIFDEMVDELGYKFLRKDRTKKEFDRYRQSKAGNKTLLHLETTKGIQNSIDRYIEMCDDNLYNLINLVTEDLPVQIKGQFTSQDQVIAAIICEYIALKHHA